MRASVQLSICAMNDRDSVFSAGSEIKGKTGSECCEIEMKHSGSHASCTYRRAVALSTIKIVGICAQHEGRCIRRCVRFEAPPRANMNIDDARISRDVIPGRKREPMSL